MAVKAKAGPGQRSCGSPTGMAGVLHLGQHLLASQIHQQGAQSEAEYPGVQLAPFYGAQASQAAQPLRISAHPKFSFS